MVVGADTHRCYCFGPFRLDTAHQQLYKNNQPVELPRRLVRALQLLIENRGRDLDKTYLIEQLWPNIVVEEHNLAVIISMLRKVLGDRFGHKKYILTNPRRGYRFMADVTEFDPNEPELKAAQAAGTGTESTIAETRSAQRHRLLQLSLSRPLMSAAASLALVAVFLGIYQRNRHEVTQSIAVLPFQSLGAERGVDYLGLGMADALIARLRNIRHIVVRPTADVAKYQERTDDPLVVGKQLHVASLLEGTFQRTGGELLLQVKLLRVKDGATLWAQEYRGRFSDILTLQDDIAEQATRALALKMDTVEQSKIRRRYTASSDAYQIYLAARYFCGAGSADDRSIEKGITYFQQAIETDPRFALAFAGLAACYLQLTETPANAEILRKAELAAQRALAIDGTLQDAYLVLGVTKAAYDWDYPAAEWAFRKSIALADDNAEPHIAYARFLSGQGRFQEAQREAREATELDPNSWEASRALNEVYFFGHRYREAVERWEQGAGVSLAEGAWYLGWIYAQENRPNSMAEKLKQVQLTALHKEFYAAQLAYVYALHGMRPLAESYLQQFFLYDGDTLLVENYQISLIYVALGDKDGAFQFLQRAKEKHESRLLYARVDPRLDSVRSDPRFSELLRSVHLGP